MLPGWLQIALLGAIVVASTWYARHSANVVIGLTMTAAWAITSVLYMNASFGIRALLNVLLIGAIVKACKIVWEARGGCVPIIVTVICVGQVAFIASLLWAWINPRWFDFVYGAAMQVFFLAKCAAIVLPRLWDDARTRFSAGADRGLVGGARTAHHVVEP